MKVGLLWYFYNNCVWWLWHFRHRNHISWYRLAMHASKFIKETPSVDNPIAVACHSRPFPTVYALSMFVLSDWSSSFRRSTTIALYTMLGEVYVSLSPLGALESMKIRWKLRQNNYEAKWRVVTEAKGGYEKQMCTYSSQRKERSHLLKGRTPNKVTVIR